MKYISISIIGLRGNGIPNVLTADQGSKFKNHHDEMMKFLNTKTSSYYSLSSYGI